MHRGARLVAGQATHGVHDGLDGALHVALDHQRQHPPVGGVGALGLRRFVRCLVRRLRRPPYQDVRVGVPNLPVPSVEVICLHR